MIVAWRIPMLTEQFRAATMRAAAGQWPGMAQMADVPEAEQTLERRLVQGLERLGYRVTLERAA